MYDTSPIIRIRTNYVTSSTIEKHKNYVTNSKIEQHHVTCLSPIRNIARMAALSRESGWAQANSMMPRTSLTMRTAPQAIQTTVGHETPRKKKTAKMSQEQSKQKQEKDEDEVVVVVEEDEKAAKEKE